MARGRAFRRHQDRLAKRWARDYLREWMGDKNPEPGRVGFWASVHCCPCSCWMCGNARRTEGPTWQELLAELAQKELTL